MAQPINTRKSARTLAEELKRICRSLAGSGGPSDHAAAFRNHFTYQLFTLIERNFYIKSAGGTDEFGIRWKPLKRETKAYRPQPGQRRTSHKAEHRNIGLLTPDQTKLWKGIYASMLKRYALRMGQSAARVRAAKVAWAVLKSKGALTKLQLYGDRKLPMLVVSGRLVESVSAGTLSGHRYYKPKEQVCDIQGDRVRFGSAVPYAARQNAMRPILPPRGTTAGGWLKQCVQDAINGFLAVVKEKNK